MIGVSDGPRAHCLRGRVVDGSDSLMAACTYEIIPREGRPYNQAA